MTSLQEDAVRSGDDPFPWKILDDVFPEELVRAASAEWPLVSPDAWHVYAQGKKATKHRSNLPPACEELITRMASLQINGLFDCEGLFPDMTLHGAGIHDMPSGCRLDAHLDGDHHPTLGWTREISGILFLNEDWHPSWGGELQLLDDTGKEVRQWITPKFNRLALFRCQGTAWHKVTQVICPNNQSRKTLALFWWSHRQNLRNRPTALFQSPAESVPATHA